MVILTSCESQLLSSSRVIHGTYMGLSGGGIGAVFIDSTGIYERYNDMGRMISAAAGSWARYEDTLVCKANIVYTLFGVIAEESRDTYLIRQVIGDELTLESLSHNLTYHSADSSLFSTAERIKHSVSTFPKHDYQELMDTSLLEYVDEYIPIHSIIDIAALKELGRGFTTFGYSPKLFETKSPKKNYGNYNLFDQYGTGFLGSLHVMYNSDMTQLLYDNKDEVVVALTTQNPRLIFQDSLQVGQILNTQIATVRKTNNITIDIDSLNYIIQVDHGIITEITCGRFLKKINQ